MPERLLMIFHSANNLEQTIQDNPGRADHAPTAYKQHGESKQTPPRFRGEVSQSDGGEWKTNDKRSLIPPRLSATPPLHQGGRATMQIKTNNALLFATRALRDLLLHTLSSKQSLIPPRPCRPLPPCYIKVGELKNEKAPPH